jgi:GTP-dependent phosphoenolpyruvate carboxykinase
MDFFGMKISEENFQRLFAVDPKEWKAELEDAQTFLAQFGGRMPQKIWDMFNHLKAAFLDFRYTPLP